MNASVPMGSSGIDLERLRIAVNAIIDHLIQDLGIKSVQIDGADDFYWTYSSPEVYDSSKKPGEPEVGRLTDDADFVRLVRRGESGDISYSLVHVAPLLKYIGEKVKR
jgi:hypothetical protein